MILCSFNRKGSPTWHAMSIIRKCKYWGPFLERKHFGPEKPFVKLRPAYSVKLVFSCVVKRIKIKVTAKFSASRCLRFEGTKRNMSAEKFRDFRETGSWPEFFKG